MKFATHHYKAYEDISPSRPELSQKGRSILVTGGGYGIGASIARSFAAAGAARVAITGRTESKLKATASTLTTDFPGTKTTYYVGDVADEAAVLKIYEDFGIPDVLVNNAALLNENENMGSRNSGFVKQFWRTFEVNVLGIALMTHHLLRLKDKDQRPTIIAVNSTGAIGAVLPGFTAYGGTKAAVARMFELEQCAHEDVRFVNVHPGLVPTEMGEEAAKRGAVIPPTDAEVMGGFCLWVASPEADFVAGRFLWANWDVRELNARREEILEKNLCRFTLAGV